MIARCILAVYPIPLRRITRLVLSHGRSNVVQSSLLTTSQNLSTLSTPFSSSVHLEEEATLTAPVPRR